MVRRQSIASISSASCAGVNAQCAVDDRRPDEFVAFKPLGEQAQPAAVPVQTFQIMTALAAEDEDMAAERIGANHLLHLGRQTVEPGAQIDRPAGEKDLGSRRQGDHPGPPQRRQYPPQRLLVDAAVNAHPNPVRQIDLDHPGTLGQRQTRAARAYSH